MQFLPVQREIKILLFLGLITQSFTFAIRLVALIIADIPGVGLAHTATVLSGAIFFASLAAPLVGLGVDRGAGVSLAILAIVLNILGLLGLAFAPLGPWSSAPYVLACFLASTISPILGSSLIEGRVDSETRLITSTMLAVVGNMGAVISSTMAFFWFKSHREVLLMLDAGSTTLFVAYLGFCFHKFRVKDAEEVSLDKSAVSVGHWLSRFDASDLLRLGSCLLLMIALYAQLYFFPLLFKAAGLDEYRFTTAMGIVSGASVVLIGIMLSSGWIFKTYLGKVRAACVFSAMGIGFILFCRNLSQLVGATVILSIGEVPIYPIVSQVVYSTFPRDRVGAAASVKIILGALAQMLTPFLAILLIGQEPILQAAWCVLPFVLIFFILRRPGKGKIQN